MKKLFYVLLIGVATLFGLTFSVKNPQIIRIEYYFGVDFQAALPLLLLGAFACGLLLGCLMLLLKAFTAGRRLSKAQRALRQAAAEKGVIDAAVTEGAMAEKGSARRNRVPFANASI